MHVVGGVLVLDGRSLVGLGNGVGGVDRLAVRGAIFLVQERRSGEFTGKAICVEGILLGLRVRPGHWELVLGVKDGHKDLSRKQWRQWIRESHH